MNAAIKTILREIEWMDERGGWDAKELETVSKREAELCENIANRALRRADLLAAIEILKG